MQNPQVPTQPQGGQSTKQPPTLPLSNSDNQFELMKKLADQRMQLSVSKMHKIKSIVNMDLDLKNGSSAKKSTNSKENGNKFKIYINESEDGFSLAEYFQNSSNKICQNFDLSGLDK